MRGVACTIERVEISQFKYCRHGRIECYALTDTCEGSVSCLDKIARMFRGPYSDNGRSIPIECVAGRQAMQDE